MKVAVALALTLVLFASPALAQDGTLRMAWDACPGDPGAAPGKIFSCDPQASSAYRLVSVFTLRDTAGSVVLMEGSVDFAFQASPHVPPFWHFESGACNASGLLLRDGRPLVGCTGAQSLLCGAGGVSCDGQMTGYIAGPAGGQAANHARLYFRFQRPQATPVRLPPGAYFGFDMDFVMDNAGSALCSGCSQVVAITWMDATLFDTAGTPVAALTSTDPGSDATVFANCSSCGIVRDRRPGWGLLKALYR